MNELGSGLFKTSKIIRIEQVSTKLWHFSDTNKIEKTRPIRIQISPDLRFAVHKSSHDQSLWKRPRSWNFDLNHFCGFFFTDLNCELTLVRGFLETSNMMMCSEIKIFYDLKYFFVFDAIYTRKPSKPLCLGVAFFPINTKSLPFCRSNFFEKMLRKMRKTCFG